jgi:6,7-dimethyl-8-ribityllumazine synthase
VTETAHQGLMKVQLEEVIPIIFGILACENLKQVKDRISSKGLDKGKEFAQAALIQTLI